MKTWKSDSGMSATIDNFVPKISVDFDPEPERDVFGNLFSQYERVVVQSIITSFGLDFFIMDRRGGDVDTILNVRKGEEGGGYKNAANAAAYDNRGEWKDKEILYRSHPNLMQMKRDAREKYHSTGETVEDAYTGGLLHFLGKSKNAPSDQNAEAEHIISANTIWEDKGRVLSGLKGEDLANSSENLVFTNKSLNASLGAYMKNVKKKHPDAPIAAKEIPGYIEAHPELPEETKARMMEHYNKARDSYEWNLAATYYTNPRFWKDSGFAAAKVGAQMGLRQALGFVMTEVWFSVKEMLAEAGPRFEDKLKAIAVGIRVGFERAKDKYKELLSKFNEGTVSGVMASLMTTLCNIFFTTAKNVGRIIRQTWASIVEAAKILIINPDNLPFYKKMQVALKIIAAGASVVLGTMVQEAVHKSLVPYLTTIPMGETIQSIVSIFAGTLCTGSLTVSLLYLIDSDPFGGFFTKAIDGTIVEYKRQARLFEEHAAKLEKHDIARFEQETTMYHNLALSLETAKNDNELSALLTQAAEQIGVTIPWGEGLLDDFMNNGNAKLVFEA